MTLPLSERLRAVLQASLQEYVWSNADHECGGLNKGVCVQCDNAADRLFDRVDRNVLPLLTELQEEREREIREAVQRLVKKATEPVTFMDAYRCSVCGASFHPPQVHTAHPWCPVYNLSPAQAERAEK